MAMIKCIKCEQEKNESEFNNTERKRTASARCKICLYSYKDLPEDQRKPRERDLQETNVTCMEWQGGKYKGTIITKPDVFFARVGKVQKSFNFKGKEDQKDDIKKEAIKWKNIKSDEFGLTTNKYKIIFDSDTNNPKYLIVQLSKNYVTLIDYDLLEFVKDNNVCVTKSSNQNSKHYAIYVHNDKNRTLHGHITGAEMTDHINGYPLDNRKVNLRATTYSQNNSNRSLISQAKCIQLGDKYEGTIYYMNYANQYQKVLVREIFDDADSCKEWIRKKSIEINNHLNTDSAKVALKTEFEDIMNKYAKGFLWQDVIVEEDKNSEDDKSNNDANYRLHQDVTNEKMNIYKKFIDVYPDWNITNELTSLKIEHIKHNGCEYKYCTKCSTWRTIDCYHKSSSKHDGLDTRCKECCKARNR
jgi:hypothetical protein